MSEPTKPLSNPLAKNIKYIKFDINKNNKDSKTEFYSPKFPTISRNYTNRSQTHLNLRRNINNSNIINTKMSDGNISTSLFNSSKNNNKDSFSLREKKGKKINFIPLLKSFSQKKLSNLPNLRKFHQTLMFNNKLSYEKAVKEEFLNFENQQKNKINISDLLLEVKEKEKKINTGIYGPKDNIVSVIRAKMERLKYDNEYIGVKEEIKEMIKDEIIDAQVKLKRKPNELNKKKFMKRPLYLKKMDKYRYLSKMNKIRQINQISTVPIIVKDGQVIIRLINDAFGNLKESIM